MEEEQIEVTELETTESTDAQEDVDATPSAPEDVARQLFASYLEPDSDESEAEPQEEEDDVSGEGEETEIRLFDDDDDEDEPDEATGDEDEEAQDGRNWFVVHSYSGYENKVKKNLEHRIESLGMQDKIFQVVVPTEEEIELKDG